MMNLYTFNSFEIFLYETLRYLNTLSLQYQIHLLFVLVVSDQQALMEIMAQYILYLMHSTQIILAFNGIYGYRWYTYFSAAYQLYTFLAACREAPPYCHFEIRNDNDNARLPVLSLSILDDINNVEFGKIMVA